MITNISSTKNDRYKFFKSLKQKKVRTDSGLYTVEGIKSVNDAISANAPVCDIIITEGLYGELKMQYPDTINIYIVNNSIFSSLSSTETPQGIIAVLKQYDKKCNSLDSNMAYIYCDRLRDPGNLGTIIRTADAAGFGGVLLSPECADLYNPKTVRSSMGSFFHIDVFENIDTEKINQFRKDGFSLVCGVLSDNTVDYTKADMTKPVIITVGNEANGISEEVLSLSDVNIKIPICGNAESLNAAIAAAIIMYEVNRQRKSK